MDNLEFQRIVSANLKEQERDAVYKEMLHSERLELIEALGEGNVPSIIKEACDVDIIAQAMQYFEVGDAEELQLMRKSARGIIEANGVDFAAAKSKVVESNCSKFILKDEIKAAYEHFEKLGIKVRHEALSNDEFFGMFSSENQEVMIDGVLKKFPLDKLLKSQNYFELDEQTKWWES